ncbi:MAG: type II toxin-antitoxin system HicB family antitoxin [Nitrospinae bacterium]|nr:type II toxin-antitoxin system HicB family antitoxin [Nitrospinota bacterium]
MSGAVFEFKDYQGYVEYDEESEILHGKVLHVRDLITYEAETAKELKKAFQDSVNDYLETCEAEGIDPNKP